VRFWEEYVEEVHPAMGHGWRLCLTVYG
jgi:hypothetical protein